MTLLIDDPEDTPWKRRANIRVQRELARKASIAAGICLTRTIMVCLSFTPGDSSRPLTAMDRAGEDKVTKRTGVTGRA
jgi:hypothetical protein